jgi:SAM-dependent methyltransferase
MGTDSVQDFYDGLAADYHLLFTDWNEAVSRQGRVLDALIQKRRAGSRRLLDASCGIGTQALGLAGLGYNVHATDLSPNSIERARAEAQRRGLNSISFGVADLRTLDAQISERFEVAISCDNALPHLLEDDELRAALSALKRVLMPGGLLLLTLRDYDALSVERPKLEGMRLLEGPDGMRVVFQVWEWADDGRTYRVNQFVVRHHGEHEETIHHATRYRALKRAELDALLASAGFVEVRWHTPEQSGFYQPVVSALNAS